MLRVGIISDTHGLLRPQALKALADSELILHAGDVGSPEILERLGEIAPVKTVRGNVDGGAWMAETPETLRLTLESVELFLHHGHIVRSKGDFDGIGVIVQGHSHRPLVESRDGILLVNPGSAGPRRFRLPVTLALLTVDGEEADAELIDLLDERWKS